MESKRESMYVSGTGRDGDWWRANEQCLTLCRCHTPGCRARVGPLFDFEVGSRILEFDHQRTDFFRGQTHVIRDELAFEIDFTFLRLRLQVVLQAFLFRSGLLCKLGLLGGLCCAHDFITTYCPIGYINEGRFEFILTLLV